MEAFLMFKLPLKATRPVKFSSFLPQVIKDAYSPYVTGPDIEKQFDFYTDLENKRNKCTQMRAGLSSKEHLDSLVKYFDTICYLEEMLPGIKSKIPFVWTDLMKNTKICKYSLDYEKMCILFNIAILHGIIAADIVIKAGDNISAQQKNEAVTNFAKSADIFKKLEESEKKFAFGTLPFDLATRIVDAFKNLMLSQALDIIVMELRINKCFDILPGGCVLAARFHQTVLILEREKNLPQFLQDLCECESIKVCIYNAVAHWYTLQDVEKGEKIYRLNVVITQLQKCVKKPEWKMHYGDMLDDAKEMIIEEKYLNDMVYNERIRNEEDAEKDVQCPEDLKIKLLNSLELPPVSLQTPLEKYHELIELNRLFVLNASTKKEIEFIESSKKKLECEIEKFDKSLLTKKEEITDLCFASSGVPVIFIKLLNDDEINVTEIVESIKDIKRNHNTVIEKIKNHGSECKSDDANQCKCEALKTKLAKYKDSLDGRLEQFENLKTKLNNIKKSYMAKYAKDEKSMKELIPDACESDINKESERRKPFAALLHKIYMWELNSKSLLTAVENFKFNLDAESISSLIQVDRKGAVDKLDDQLKDFDEKIMKLVTESEDLVGNKLSFDDLYPYDESSKRVTGIIQLMRHFQDKQNASALAVEVQKGLTELQREIISMKSDCEKLLLPDSDDVVGKSFKITQKQKLNLRNMFKRLK